VIGYRNLDRIGQPWSLSAAPPKIRYSTNYPNESTPTSLFPCAAAAQVSTPKQEIVARIVEMACAIVPDEPINNADDRHAKHAHVLRQLLSNRS